MEKLFKIISKIELNNLIKSGNSRYGQSKKLKDGTSVQIYLGIPVCVVINKKIHLFFDDIKGLEYYSYLKELPGHLKSTVCSKTFFIKPDIQMSPYTPQSLLDEISKTIQS